jgi:phosphatidylglycerophosphatase A
VAQRTVSRFHPALLVATVFGIGYTPRAPGTAGTLVAVPLCFALSSLSITAFALVTAAVIGVGTWASHLADRLLSAHDSQEIVIDEVAGYMLTVLLIDRSDWLWLGVGFLVFRILDIAKPFPIRWVDKNVQGGFGVMADDLAAGILGTLVCFVTFRFFQ